MPEHRHAFHTPLPATLEVSIPAGDIVVDTVDGDETIVEVSGDEQLLEQLEVRQDGNRVVVVLRGKSKFGFVVAFGSHVFGNAGLHVQARIPHGAAAQMKTTSADTRISGRLRTLELNSTSGDVVVRGEIEHDATVKTVSGDGEFGPVGGNLAMQSVSGDLRAGTVGGSIDMKSVSGDIRVEAASSGDVRFSSVSGDIEVGIAAGSLLDVDAGSTSGDLSSEVALASDPPQGTDTETAPTVVLRGRTVSGDVRVFRAG